MMRQSAKSSILLATLAVGCTAVAISGCEPEGQPPPEENVIDVVRECTVGGEYMTTKTSSTGVESGVVCRDLTCGDEKTQFCGGSAGGSCTAEQNTSTMCVKVTCDDGKTFEQCPCTYGANYSDPVTGQLCRDLNCPNQVPLPLCNGINGEPGPPGSPGRDGMNGQPGRDGMNGQPGRDGMNGQDGASCRASRNAMTGCYVFDCDNQPPEVWCPPPPCGYGPQYTSTVTATLGQLCRNFACPGLDPIPICIPRNGQDANCQFTSRITSTEFCFDVQCAGQMAPMQVACVPRPQPCTSSTYTSSTTGQQCTSMQCPGQAPGEPICGSVCTSRSVGSCIEVTCVSGSGMSFTSSTSQACPPGVSVSCGPLRFFTRTSTTNPGRQERCSRQECQYSSPPRTETIVNCQLLPNPCDSCAAGTRCENNMCVPIVVTDAGIVDMGSPADTGGNPDAMVLDTGGNPDATVPDMGPPDTGGNPDAMVPDATPVDGGVGNPDAMPQDTGPPDSGADPCASVTCPISWQVCYVGQCVDEYRVEVTVTSLTNSATVPPSVAEMRWEGFVSAPGRSMPYTNDLTRSSTSTLPHVAFGLSGVVLTSGGNTGSLIGVNAQMFDVNGTPSPSGNNYAVGHENGSPRAMFSAEARVFDPSGALVATVPCVEFYLPQTPTNQNPGGRLNCQL